MTPEEFITEYLALQSREDVQQTLIDTAQNQLTDIDAAQAELSTQHLDELTELRAGQTIELAGKDDHGIYRWTLPPQSLRVVEVLQADVFTTEDSRLPDGGPTDIYITVLVSAVQGQTDSIALSPHPGRQWRYISHARHAWSVAETRRKAQAAKVGGGKEAV